MPYLSACPWAPKDFLSGLMCAMPDKWICSLVVHCLPATRRCDSHTVCKKFRIIFPYCPLSQSRKIKKSRFVVFCVVHRLVGSAFLSNGYMGGLASRRAGGSRSIQQSCSMICRYENMTTNGLQGVRGGCAEGDGGARSKFRAGQMVET